MGFILVENHSTSASGPNIWYHTGDGTALSALGSPPGAVTNTGSLVSHRNPRSFSVGEKIFVSLRDKIFKSTDEGVTFILEPTLGTIPNFDSGGTGGWGTPVPVMVNGALKYFFVLRNSATNFLQVMQYDVAADTFSIVNASTSQSSGSTNSQLASIEFNGKLYGGSPNSFTGVSSWVYDPVTNGMSSLSSLKQPNLAQQLINWNGAPHHVAGRGNVGPVVAVRKLVGAAWVEQVNFDADQTGTGGGIAAFPDPNTDNLIVIYTRESGVTRAYSISTSYVATNISGAVLGAGLLAYAATMQLWTQIVRSTGGGHAIRMFGANHYNAGNVVQRFDWVDDATQIVEFGIVPGTADMQFPTLVYDGGEHLQFVPGGKRIVQTAQTDISTGLSVTFEAFQDGGTTVSAKLRHKASSVVDNIPLTASTIANPTGDVGLSLSGANPGKQIDGIPADSTPITIEWDAVTDGFGPGDGYGIQLEAI